LGLKSIFRVGGRYREGLASYLNAEIPPLKPVAVITLLEERFGGVSNTDTRLGRVASNVDYTPL
jgi:hypothetical protein